LVIADIIKRSLARGYRVLNLVPTMELAMQNYEECFNYIDDKHDLGMYCAGLNKRQGNKKAIIAMTDSFLNARFKCGKFDVLLIDEADLVGYCPKTKYRRIIDALKQINTDIRIAGVTGSPYRMGTGLLENPHHEHGASVFTMRSFCTDELIPEMIEKGYISNIESLSGDIQADLSNVKLNSIGEYNTELMAAKFDAIIPHAVRDMVVKINANNIKTAIVFASSLDNARKIIDEYKEVTGLDNIRLVSGDSEKKLERKRNIDWLANAPGQRILVNVGILTRGYNYRALDCIVFMRSTMSLALYVQIIGRVIRSHDDKECGYVIDYGGNIDRHGAIDDIKPPEPKKKGSKAVQKECISVATQVLTKTINEVDYTLIPGMPCGFMNHASAKKCALCESEFIPDPDAPGGYSMRSHAEILALKEKKKEQIYIVDGVWFDKQVSGSGFEMIVVKYYQADKCLHKQFLCLDQQGYPRHSAIKFLKHWAKSVDNINELHDEGMMNIKDMLSILEDRDMLERYFKKIVAIKLKPKPDSKYKELTAVEFE